MISTKINKMILKIQEFSFILLKYVHTNLMFYF